jgi:hypothetical protein
MPGCSFPGSTASVTFRSCPLEPSLITGGLLGTRNHSEGVVVGTARWMFPISGVPLAWKSSQPLSLVDIRLLKASQAATDALSIYPATVGKGNRITIYQRGRCSQSPKDRKHQLRHISSFFGFGRIQVGDCLSIHLQTLSIWLFLVCSPSCMYV